MATLRAAIGATQTWLPIAPSDAVALDTGYYRLEDELVRLSPESIGGGNESDASITGRACRRGLLGTTALPHAAGTLIERVYPAFVTATGLLDSNGAPASESTPHPNLATHEALGLAPDHLHPYAVVVHDHDDLAPAAHAHPTYATDGDLTNHAATPHGVTAHALDGVYHSGSEVLPTAGQKNALAGTTGTPGDANRFVTHQDARLADARPPTVHEHDADYAAVDHGHVLVDADVPATIARDGEITAAIDAHVEAQTHGSAPEAFPVGSGFVSFLPTNPAQLLGYGTWASRGAGRVLVGVDAGQSAGDLLGSATHGHVVTQPADHGALSHSGATVANHAVTQPSPHADHAAQAHSAHAGATVGNHTVTQPAAHADHGPLAHSAHAGAAVANHTDVLNHVHGEQLQGGTTGTTTGTHVMGSAATGGSLRSAGQSTLNPTSGGVAAQVHAVTQSSAHSDHAAFSHAAHSGTGVDAHTVGQASGHTDHGALSHGAHSGTAVDAHTVGQASQHAAQSHTGAAVAASAHLPPAIAVYLWERTA